MNIQGLERALSAGMKVITGLVEDVGDEEMRFKPAKDRWSLLEIINHLADEEVDDFRTRLSYIIEDPSREWPAIHPFEWVESREYGQRDPAESIARFTDQRLKSLAWLGSITEPDLSTAYAGKKGPRPLMHTGDIVASWAAHDYFHIRQITNLRWEYLMQAVNPYSCSYAGEY